jgi:Flp pilus assembly protein TadD
MRLNPLALEKAYSLSGLGFAHLIAGDAASAVQWGERSVQHSPTWAAGHRLLIAALMLSHREAEAREAAMTLRRVAPDSSHVRNVANAYRSKVWTERYLAALRGAGLSD